MTKLSVQQYNKSCKGYRKSWMTNFAQNVLKHQRTKYMYNNKTLLMHQVKKYNILAY